MSITACRHFSGYKPCGKHLICDQLCPSLSIPSLRVLIISLEALGSVLRSTAILPAIKKKFPGAHITWVTKAPAQQMLCGNPLIDRVLILNTEDQLILSALEFDIAYVIDKSLAAVGVLRRTQVDMIYGFIADARSGSILPATNAAKELWEIGINDEKKFFKNKKSEVQLLIEALELGPYQAGNYFCPLSKSEIEVVNQRRVHWAEVQKPLIGINTGCSGVIPHKKLTVDFQRRLIEEIKNQNLGRVVLLGGPEDTLRNQQIAYGMGVVESPTKNGLRDGMLSVAACDVIVTGDSLGMHMGIGLNKWVVAWFGPTCAHEIELFGRGRKILTQASCSPCWKRQCDKSPMCYDLVSLSEIIRGIKDGLCSLDNNVVNLDL